MSRFIHKSHNVSVLLYHVVCVAKYRRVVFDDEVEAVLREVCLEIALRFEIEFLEIGFGCPLGRAITFIFWCKACPSTDRNNSCKLSKASRREKSSKPVRK